MKESIPLGQVKGLVAPDQAGRKESDRQLLWGHLKRLRAKRAYPCPFSTSDFRKSGTQLLPIDSIGKGGQPGFLVGNTTQALTFLHNVHRAMWYFREIYNLIEDHRERIPQRGALRSAIFRLLVATQPVVGDSPWSSLNFWRRKLKKAFGLLKAPLQSS